MQLVPTFDIIRRGLLAAILSSGCASTDAASPRTSDDARNEVNEATSAGEIEPFALGTPHPIFVQRASAEYGWVVACQARADTNANGGIEVSVGHHGNLFGDRVSPYLITAGAPEGVPIAALHAASTDGRWLVISHLDGTLALHDMRDGRRSVLEASRGVEPLSEGSFFARSAPMDFDPGGTQFAHFRQTIEPTLFGIARVTFSLWLRHPSSGLEVPIPAGEAKIFRATFIGEGRRLLVGVVEADTNGNGVLESPMLRTTRARGGCIGPAASYSTYGYDGDQPSFRIYDIANSRFLDGELLVDAGPRILLRDGEGDALWRDGSGHETVAVPARCADHIYAVYERRSAVLAACPREATETVEASSARDEAREDAGDSDVHAEAGTDDADAMDEEPAPTSYDPGPRAELVIFDLEGEHRLGAEVYLSRMHLAHASTRFHAIDERRVVDMTARRLLPRAYGGELVLDDERGRLLRVLQDHVVEYLDVDGGTRRDILPASEDYLSLRHEAGWITVRRGRDAPMTVLDASDLHVVGTLPGATILMREDGYGLVPDHRVGRVGFGPLRWRAIERAPTSTP